MITIYRSIATAFRIALAFLVLAACLSVAVPASAQAKTRPFYLGFTPFPYDISFQAVDDTYAFIAKEADLISHSFDNGIPWPEALTDAPYPKHLTDEWENRLKRQPPNHKVYVTVAPINFFRTGLANYHGEREDMPLPAPWNGYAFNHPDVKKAFLNYCRRVIAFFKPDVLNIGLEVNGLITNAPQNWASYLELHKYIYGQLKQDHPDLPIMISFMGAELLDGYKDTNPQSHRKALADILPFTDYLGISIYPYMTRYLTTPLPTDTFDKLAALTQKPLAIAETGYIAKNLIVTINGAPFTFQTTPEKQNAYIKLLLDAAQKHRFKFVVNYITRDYDALWKKIGSAELAAVWRDTGLLDPDGKVRPALETWRKALVIPVGANIFTLK